MCWPYLSFHMPFVSVSVAGCLGYDVLATERANERPPSEVSVAGCLGYDVLARLKTLTQ